MQCDLHYKIEKHLTSSLQKGKLLAGLRLCSRPKTYTDRKRENSKIRSIQNFTEQLKAFKCMHNSLMELATNKGIIQMQ